MSPRSRVVVLILGGLLLLLALPSRAIAQGEVPHIDVYTMGVGADITEKFGHAAICTRYVKNPERDSCYNYGTTNFEDPASVGWKFLRGRSRFWVSVVSPTAMMDFYVQRDRTVWVQELEFPDAQASAIADKLHFDSLEANRYYRYHHYFDNCTTRIRDILDEHSGGVLSNDSDKEIGPSFRDLSRRGFAEAPIFLVASDYILGRVGDRKPTLYEAMFLPDIFREMLQTRFGAEPILIYERQGKALSQTPGHWRFFVFFASLLLVAPLWIGLGRLKITRLHMAAAVLVLGLGGLALWSLAIVCPLPMARHNEALLLFFPADLALFWLGPERRRRYAQVRVLIVLLVTAAAGLGILQQPLWAIASLPVLTLLPLAILSARSAEHQDEHETEGDNSEDPETDEGRLAPPSSVSSAQ